MKLFSYKTEKDCYGIGIDVQGICYDFSGAFELFQKSIGSRESVSIQFLQVLIEMGYTHADLVGRVMSDPWIQAKLESLKLNEFTFQPPVSRPGKIIGIGRNYVAHAKEMDHAVPEEPLFFSKAPSSVTAPGSPIIIPSWFKGRVDHEAELAVVIGKEGRYIAAGNAYDHIAGFTIVNDVTARSMQKADMGKKHPWFRSKSLDTFCPMGPYLMPVGGLPDPHALAIELSVNGETRQKAKTSDMIFKIPDLIAYISRFMTLSPGDIIATGTPEGVSPLKPGDEVEITISELGTLKNPVLAEADLHPGEPENNTDD